MVMQLAEVVPFGRSLEEYRLMFNLTSETLKQNILGVGDGPASFNAEATQKGSKIVSVDPIYQFSGQEIKQRFDAVVDHIIEQIIATPHNWVWNYHQNPQTLKANRLKTITTFLQDYHRGKQEQRYLAQQLPHLSFSDRQYDLALCSHLLFLYSDHLDYNFHLAAIQEMLRVSQEVRIFPLLTLTQEMSPYVDQAIAHFNHLGYSTSIVRVPYELQLGGNQMLVIN